MLFISQGDLRARMLAPPVDRGVWRPSTAVNYHFLSTLEPMEVVADRMNSIRPRMAFSFGSYADQFLRFIADSGRAVALPRVWSYTGDTVSPGARALSEEELGCSLHSSYNVTEVGRIGFECERREGHHLNVDLCAVRLVGDDGASVEPGSHGEVVVSSLRNRALVLLNYRRGDWGLLASRPCPAAGLCLSSSASKGGAPMWSGSRTAGRSRRSRSRRCSARSSGWRSRCRSRSPRRG
jgi:phenylacetate-coenzyme A ligase PaaK-like adenylate-forming protein